MAITQEGSAEDATNEPATINVDIGTRTNGLLVVSIAYRSSDTLSDFTAQWPQGGTDTSMSRTAWNDNAAAWSTVIFYLVNPDDGNNGLDLTYTHSAAGSIVNQHTTISWYDGALQTQGSVLDDNNSATGNSNEPTVQIVPTQDGDVIVGVYGSETNSTLSPNGETILQDHDFGARVGGSSYVIQTTATTIDVDWGGTGGADDWAVSAAAFKEAAGAPGDPEGPLVGGKLARHSILQGRLVR